MGLIKTPKHLGPDGAPQANPQSLSTFEGKLPGLESRSGPSMVTRISNSAYEFVRGSESKTLYVQGRGEASWEPLVQAGEISKSVLVDGVSTKVSSALVAMGGQHAMQSLKNINNQQHSRNLAAAPDVVLRSSPYISELKEEYVTSQNAAQDVISFNDSAESLLQEMGGNAGGGKARVTFAVPKVSFEGAPETAPREHSSAKDGRAFPRGQNTPFSSLSKPSGGSVGKGASSGGANSAFAQAENLKKTAPKFATQKLDRPGDVWGQGRAKDPFGG